MQSLTYKKPTMHACVLHYPCGTTTNTIWMHAWRLYGLGRAIVERVNSRLDLVGLDGLKVRGLRNVLIHVLLCVIVVLLVAVAAHRLGRPHKVRSGARS
ncbi:hypothetical protein GF319_08550 [Candidatus Bathyarchaeota archaeon]|nr:hypothetical protein [Candidatus Bathyarchaeota archaeon]